MTGEQRIRDGLAELCRVATAASALAPRLSALAERYVAVLRGGGTLFFAGNGGSAADAQHLATEYVVRFSARRRALAAIALTTDSSLITAAGNDLGFDQIFARQVEALCRPGDLLILHSTSGRSPNLVAAADAAHGKGAAVVAFLGRDGGALLAVVDEAIVVPSDETSRVQELHLTLEHLIVQQVEEALIR